MSEELAKYDPEKGVMMQKISEGLFQSGLFPNARNKFGAFAIIEYGYELGIPPMMALKNINIISGQLSCNGQLMLSQAMKVGAEFEVLEETDKKCSIKFTRGKRSYTATFTEDDAKAAGLTGKDNWKKYPKDMLYWRAVAKGVRRIAPDAVMGLYTADEISEGAIIDAVEVKDQPPPDIKQDTVYPPADSILIEIVDANLEEKENPKGGKFTVYNFKAGDGEIYKSKKEEIYKKLHGHFFEGKKSRITFEDTKYGKYIRDVIEDENAQ